MSKVRILLSSNALRNKLYPIVQADLEYNPVIISVYNGKLIIDEQELDVEASASPFSGEYELFKVRTLHKILLLLSDQPITLELGYSDWITIRDINI